MDTMIYHGVTFTENNRFWGFHGVSIKEEEVNEDASDKDLQEF